MLHSKLKAITKCSNTVAYILPEDPLPNNPPPVLTFGVGELGFMLCDLYVSLKFVQDINSTNMPCLTSVRSADTPDSQISSFN